MAESIKLANDKYIDASGVYNSTLGKTLNEYDPSHYGIGKVISFYDSYVLNFFANANVSLTPSGGVIEIGGPVLGCVYMKHSTAGGSLIVFSYQTTRPIFYHIVNGVIQDEYYL